MALSIQRIVEWNGRGSEHSMETEALRRWTATRGAAGGGGRRRGAARAVGGAGRWRQLEGGRRLHDWRSCARRYRIWDCGSIDKTTARGRAAPVPFVPATREAVFTLALFVIPFGPWAEEQVVPDGMGTDAEPPAGPHLLSLADVGALGFDCALKPAPALPAGAMPADLNTPVTTSDLPAFFPSLLEPPPISGAPSIRSNGFHNLHGRRHQIRTPTGPVGGIRPRRRSADSVVNKQRALLQCRVLQHPSRLKVH